MERKKIHITGKAATQFIGSFIIAVFMAVFGGVFYAHSNNPLYLSFVLCGAIILVQFVFRNKVLRLNFLYNSIVGHINILQRKEELPKGLEARARTKGRSVPDLQQYYSGQIQNLKNRSFGIAKRNLEDIVKLNPDFPYLKELKKGLSSFSGE